jgi:hypothetical protein
MPQAKLMVEATLSTKNQILIQREAREALGSEAGRQSSFYR